VAVARPTAAIAMKPQKKSGEPPSGITVPTTSRRPMAVLVTPYPIPMADSIVNGLSVCTVAAGLVLVKFRPLSCP